LQIMVIPTKAISQMTKCTVKEKRQCRGNLCTKAIL